MVKVDIINLSNTRKNIKDNNITNLINKSDSNCILFLNSKDKIQKNSLEKMSSVSKDNNFKKIISPNFISELSLRGKLIPTEILQEFINRKQFDDCMYELLYATPTIKCNDIIFDNGKLSYMECRNELFNSIIYLDKLETYLKENNLYEEDKFKKLYIKEIISKYLQFRKNQSLLYKRFSEDYFTLVVIYILMLVKFDSAKEFVFELSEENSDFLLNYDLEKVKSENFETINRNNKEKLINTIKKIMTNSMQKQKVKK